MVPWPGSARYTALCAATVCVCVSVSVSVVFVRRQSVGVKTKRNKHMLAHLLKPSPSVVVTAGCPTALQVEELEAGVWGSSKRK